MLKTHEDIMHVPLARYLTDLPSSTHLSQSDKSALITRIHPVCPQALLPVLPSLMSQLHGSDGSVHVGVVDLVGQLLSTPSHGLGADYQALLTDLLACCESENVRFHGWVEWGLMTCRWDICGYLLSKIMDIPSWYTGCILAMCMHTHITIHHTRISSQYLLLSSSSSSSSRASSYDRWTCVSRCCAWLMGCGRHKPHTRLARLLHNMSPCA